MGNPTMTSDFPKEGQRTAVCYAQWNKKEVGEVEEKHRGIKDALNDFGGWIIDKFRKDTGAVDIIADVKEDDSPDGETDDINEKQATKTDGGIQFRASDYAVVPDVEKPSTWKLRLAEGNSGNFTVAQVARAITAMQPGGFRGQKVELTPEEKSQAISRIGTAIAKCDGDDNQKKNLRTRLSRVKELSEIVNSSFWIEKSLKAGEEGRLRWYGFPSNKWRDSDIPAQIITEEAHKEFVEYLKNTKDYPVLLSWHTPGTRIGQADWAEYDHGFLIMGGLIDKNKHAEAQKLAEKCQKEAIGMSHGFVYSYSNKEQELIGKYRTWEVSHLPIPYAANKWTSIDIIHKEVEAMGFSEEKKRHLDEIHGEGFAASLEGKAADLEKDLLSAGVEFKDLDIVEPEVKEADPHTIAEIAAKAIVEGEGFKAIATAIAGVEDQLKELKEVTIPGLEQKIANAEAKAQKSQDDVIADAMKSRSSAFQASKDGPAPDEKEKDLTVGPESLIDPGFIAVMTGVPDFASGIPAQ